MPVSYKRSATAVELIAPRDIEAVSHAFFLQWGYETRSGEMLARRIARWYVAKMLSMSTFGFVTHDDGGMLTSLAIGRCEGDAPLFEGQAVLPPYQRLEEEISRSAEGRETLALYHMIYAANAALRERVAKKGRLFDAELFFLWVSPDARGLGLSKTILAPVKSHLEKRGIGEYCLFTDTNCDWRYYQRAPFCILDKLAWPNKPASGWEGEEIMVAVTLN